MSSDHVRRLALGLGLLVLTGCPGSVDDWGPFEVEAGADAGPATTSCGDVPTVVFLPHCGLSACHGSTNPAAGLDLVSPDVYARLSGKTASGGPGLLIDPGQPSKSVLLLKLSSPPPFGSQMPLTGGKLDAPTVACVASWISAGDADATTTDDAAGPDPDSSAPADDAAGSDAPSSDVPEDSGAPDVTSAHDAGTKPDGSPVPDGGLDAGGD